MSENKGLGAVLEAAESVSKSDHEAAVKAAREEGHKSGFEAGKAAGLEEGRANAKPAEPELAAAREAGATAERGRILGIQAHGVPGAEKIVADAVADGKTTADQAGARILAHLREQGPQALAAMKNEQPGPVGHGAPQPGPTTMSAADASKAIGAEMAAAEKEGRPISFAEAGARVRSRHQAA
jgi:hypothetical protein